jgi:hypothetical protein
MNESARMVGFLLLFLFLVACAAATDPKTTPAEEEQTIPESADVSDSAASVAPITSPTPAPSATPLPASPTGAISDLVTLTPSPLPPSTAEPVASPTAELTHCFVVAVGDIMAYRRPSIEAAEFGIMIHKAGAFALGITEDDWVGFDPGVAQAANVGIFRLRWVAPDQYTLEGPCDDLPLLIGPPPEICFMMPMNDVFVYVAPDSASAVAAAMVPGDYAAVTGKSGQDWYRLDLSLGNLNSEGVGWYPARYANLNGQCEIFEE